MVRGRYEEAERMCQKLMKALRKILDGEGIETSYSLNLFVSTYRNQGRWAEAEKMELQVMETRKQVQGDEHPDTLSSMANLAQKGKFKGASHPPYC